MCSPGHDRGDQPAAEGEAAHAIHPQRVARHLHDDGVGPGIAQPAQRPVQLHRRRRRQPVAGIVERAVARAERAEDPRPRTARVEQHAEDLARARLPERSREPDDPERLGRRSVEARGQHRERVPRRVDAHDRHLFRHVTPAARRRWRPRPARSRRRRTRARPARVPGTATKSIPGVMRRLSSEMPEMSGSLPPRMSSPSASRAKRMSESYSQRRGRRHRRTFKHGVTEERSNGERNGRDRE